VIRVCMVGSHGAYPSVNQGLVGRLREDGHVALLTSVQRNRVAKLLDMGYTLLRRRRDYDITVVDTFSTSALWYARFSGWMAKRLGKKLVLVLHGGELPRVARKSPARLRRLLARADHIVAPSSYLAREVGDAMGVTIDVIHNPVPTRLYPTRVRGPARPRLLWVRNFRELYRPQDAVEVAAQLHAHFPDVSLVMAGPERDGSQACCRRLARERGVSAEFPGLVEKDELRRLGDHADIFLNTTTADNTPVSVIEAMAMGLCIVSTNVGGMPDLLRDGETGLLVPPGDPGAMADAVKRVLLDPALARKLSTNAATAARDFDFEEVVPRWYRLFEELCPSVNADARSSHRS